MNRPSVTGVLPKALLAALKGDSAIACAKTFAAQACADAAPDELPELTDAELAANLAAFWKFGERRRGRAPTVRVAPVIGGKSASATSNARSSFRYRTCR